MAVAHYRPHREGGGGGIRVWDDDSKGYGDPYDIGIGVEWDTPNRRAILELLDKEITKDHWKAVKKCLADAGFAEAAFERLNAEYPRFRVFDLRKPEKR